MLHLINDIIGETYEGEMYRVSLLTPDTDTPDIFKFKLILKVLCSIIEVKKLTFFIYYPIYINLILKVVVVIQQLVSNYCIKSSKMGQEWSVVERQSIVAVKYNPQYYNLQFTPLRILLWTILIHFSKFSYP